MQTKHTQALTFMQSARMYAQHAYTSKRMQKRCAACVHAARCAIRIQAAHNCFAQMLTARKHMHAMQRTARANTRKTAHSSA